MRWLYLFYGDLRAKAEWCYEDRSWKSIIKTLLTDGTMAMLYYRLMQGARRWKLFPLEMLFNKLNAIFCQCIIGRGAEFGSELVLIHSQGIVINAKVRGGNRIKIEHQVTIGAERRNFPTLADDIFIGAGAKIIGSVQIGEGAKIGANAVVIHDVPAHTTVVGIPAKVVRQREIPGEIQSPDEMRESGEFGSPFATDVQR